MKAKLKEEIVEEQADFISKKGTRSQIMNLKLIIEKYREYNRALYICFVHYRKVFDTVSHNKLWQIMFNMGFPQHLLKLLQLLYQRKRAKDGTGYGLTAWFYIEHGVRQGCTLSRCFLNISSESIMREALKGFESSMKVGKTVEVVKGHKYLGALITDNYDDTKGIRRRIAIAKHATVSIRSKAQSIS